jgi:hypothetical protein
LDAQQTEAAKPNLEKKLIWFEEAIETAAAIAVETAPQTSKESQISQLY